MRVYSVLAVLGCTVVVAPAALTAGVEVAVTHTLKAARPASVIAVPFARIAQIAPDLRMFHVQVLDPHGRRLPLQVTNYQHDHHGAQYDDLVFSYDFSAGEQRAVFKVEAIEAATAPEIPCAYARVVPERFGDMAWENDRIAHRMYGSPLDSPAAAAVGERLRGSGIDVWGKRVAYPIVDRWYAKGHDQFHRDDEGEGLDVYSIGGSRGAGGTGVWDGRKLWTSDNFLSAEVLANGPRRAVFRLGYAPWEAAGGTVRETKQFTVDCGSNFDAVESVFDLPADGGTVAIGITEHPRADGFPDAILTRDPEGRWMSYWEENKDGGLGTAVVLAADATPAGFAHDPPAKSPGYGNHLLLVKARDGTPVRYYTGAGWNRSGQFSTRESWEAHVKSFAAAAADPLRISVSARP